VYTNSLRYVGVVLTLFVARARRNTQQVCGKSKNWCLGGYGRLWEGNEVSDASFHILGGVLEMRRSLRFVYAHVAVAEGIVRQYHHRLSNPPFNQASSTEISD
jgi:hypothetical protein